MNLQGLVVGALIVVIATAGAAHGSAECNASTVADCSEHPHAFAKFKTNLGDPQSAIFRVEEDHGLGQLCENLNEMKKCIADSDCDVDKFDAYLAKEEDQEAGSVKRYFSAVDYVCTDDVKSKFVNYMKCVNEDDRDYKMKLGQCGKDHVVDDCDKMKKYFECTSEAVTGHCNKTIADVYVNALKKIDKDPCHKDNAGGTTFQHFAPIWMASCVGWLLLARWITFW